MSKINNTNESVGGRAYSISARSKRDEANACTRKIRNGRIVMGLVVAFLSILDIALFNEPITAVLYNSGSAWIALLCLVCAVAPIATAVLTAHRIRSVQFDDGNGKGFGVVLSILLGSATVALLAIGWRVRAGYWDDDSGVGLLLNCVAVAAALIAFICDFHFARKLKELEAFRDEADAERDVLEHMDYLSQFTAMDETDEARRVADDEAYWRECRKVVEEGLDSAGRARKELAKRIATTPREREHIMGTPLRIGPEDIVGGTSAEVFEHACESAGVPSYEAIRGEWGFPTNSHYLCEEQAEALAAYDARLKKIQAVGAHGKHADGEPAMDQAPIPARVEAVY